MDYSSSLWDLSATQHGLPQQLAPIDDSDFLTLLSKQLNPHSQQPQPSLLQDVSPPLTEDSASPSPPAPLGRGLNGISSTNSTPITATSIQQQKALNATRNDSAISNDEMHKRKKHQSTPEDDDDDDSDLEGQPQQKNSKGQPVKKLNAKRKSGGADETRQLKRKEQNRAAQRAFRERKEKHVKDLEDQVAALEEKSAGQLQENENLRDLLGRLQNENLMLKQSAFTFNMQRTTGAAAANTTNNNTSTQHTGSRTTPSTLPSPIDSTPKSASSPSSAAGGNESGSNQNQFNNQAYTPLINNNNNSSSSGLPSTTQMNVSPATSLGDMALSFFSPPPPPSMNIQPSPYTTIASNPMYTSYTDFGAWDQFFSSGAFDPSWSSIDNSVPSGSGAATTKANDGTTTTSNQVTSGSDNNVGPPNNNNGTGSGNNAMEDLFSSTGNFSDLIAFSSFSPNATSPLSSFQNNNGNGNGNDRISPSISPVARSTPVAAQSFSSSAFQLASRDTASSSSESRTGLVQPRTSSPCGGAEPDEAPLPCSPHHQSRFSTSGMSIKGSPSGEVTRETSCPNTSQEWAQVIESQPIGTLGGTHDIRPPVASRMEDFAMYSEAKQMKLKEVWNTIKSHPQFEECDMDELCRELSQKVRCDGSVPVMDAHEATCTGVVMQTVSKIAQRKKAKRGGAPQQQNTTVSPGPTTSASTTSSTTTTTKPVRTTPMYGTGPTSILSTMPAPITGPTTAEQLGSGPTPIPVKDLLSLYGLSGFSPPSGAFESRAETTQQQSHNSQHRSSSASSVSASNTTVSPITPVQPQQQQSPFLPSEASWANMLLDNSGNDAPSPATQFMNMMEGVAKTTPAMDTNAATASNSMEGLMSSAGMFNAQADWSSFVFGSTPSDK